jgi:hypothetical protein
LDFLDGIGEQVFPQWRPVLLQRPVPPDKQAIVYPHPENKDHGYETEVLGIVSGTVLHSHISALDNPMNHTMGAAEERPRVHHDWNLILALDKESQSMLSDANLDSGGTMEIEWQQQEDMFSLDSIPGVGDRVAVRGRYIYDCGHPPYKTEIHAPDALAVIRGDRGRLRFSTHGGPIWYQPSDIRLTNRAPKEEPTPEFPEGGGGDMCNLPDGLKAFGNQLDLKKVLELVGWATHTCVGWIDISPAGPEHMCYRPYEHSMIDLLGSTDPSVLIPLRFNVPVPTAAMRIDMQGPLTHTVEQATMPDGRPALQVTVQPSDMPTVPKTISYKVTGPEGGTVPTRTFQVLMQRVPLKRHDDMSTDFLTRLALEHLSWVPFFDLPDLSCTKGNNDDELVLYGAVNGHFQRFGNGAGFTLQTVTVAASEDLTISTHGFECDLSCGERWDDGLLDSPNDRIGTTEIAFPANEAFAGVGNTATYERIHSQPDTATVRSRSLSAGDYKLVVSITEVLTGSPP